MKKAVSVLFCVLFTLSLCGCGSGVLEQKTPKTVSDTVEIGGHFVEVDPSLAMSRVDPAAFEVEENGRIRYVKEEAATGIDVSAHQGVIDWEAVAADGIRFAMIRIGNRGYTQGAISQDEYFERNYQEAMANGLKVGVYFFSQAVTEEEALEEARFVLEVLDRRKLDLPVVFDWEPVAEPDSRTSSPPECGVTACALTFCGEVEAGGYGSAWYANGIQGYLLYDIAQLQEYALWYAEYDTEPSFAYDYFMWQYTNTGTVAGISGNVDLNLLFSPGKR